MVSTQRANVVEEARPDIHGGKLRIRTIRVEEGGVDGRVRERFCQSQDNLLGATPLREVVVGYCEAHDFLETAIRGR